LRERQTTDHMGVGPGHNSRVNLLNWDGKGTPESMFTPRPGSPRTGSGGTGGAE